MAASGIRAKVTDDRHETKRRRQIALFLVLPQKSVVDAFGWKLMRVATWRWGRRRHKRIRRGRILDGMGLWFGIWDSRYWRVSIIEVRVDSRDWMVIDGTLIRDCAWVEVGRTPIGRVIIVDSATILEERGRIGSDWRRSNDANFRTAFSGFDLRRNSVVSSRKFRIRESDFPGAVSLVGNYWIRKSFSGWVSLIHNIRLTGTEGIEPITIAPSIVWDIRWNVCFHGIGHRPTNWKVRLCGISTIGRIGSCRVAVFTSGRWRKLNVSFRRSADFVVPSSVISSVVQNRLLFAVRNVDRSAVRARNEIIGRRYFIDLIFLKIKSDRQV